MWPKTLSWVALVCSAAAVLFNVGWPVVVLTHAPHGGQLIARVFALTLVATFLSSGPLVAIFTLVNGSPIARRYRYATAPVPFR
jgi:hypothetical protein